MKYASPSAAPMQVPISTGRICLRTAASMPEKSMEGMELSL